MEGRLRRPQNDRSLNGEVDPAAPDRSPPPPAYYTPFGLTNTREVPSSTVTTFAVTVAVAGTAVQFTANAARLILIRALEANIGLVAVGGSTVTMATGVQLRPGEWHEDVPLSNSGALWLNAANATDGVRVMVLR